MGDKDSSSLANSAAGGGGMRRNKTIASFDTSATSGELTVPSMRPRLGSFDMGWISSRVRRMSLDPAAETSAIASVANTAGDAETATPASKPTTIEPANAAQIEVPRMERRKSESVLWKWFNTPMAKEHDVMSLKIAESDESGLVGGSGAGSSLTAIAKQMTQQSQEANQQFATGANAGGLSVWGKVTKEKMATRDMNALSPSNW